MYVFKKLRLLGLTYVFTIFTLLNLKFTLISGSKWHQRIFSIFFLELARQIEYITSVSSICLKNNFFPYDQHRNGINYMMWCIKIKSGQLPNFFAPIVFPIDKLSPKNFFVEIGEGQLDIIPCQLCVKQHSCS